MSADRDRETRLAEAREEIADEVSRHAVLVGARYAETPDLWFVWCACGWDGKRYGPDANHRYQQHVADAVLTTQTFRAAGEGDRLRRDLAALAEELDGLRENAERRVSAGFHNDYDAGIAIAYDSAADRIRDLLDGGEGGR